MRNIIFSLIFFALPLMAQKSLVERSIDVESKEKNAVIAKAEMVNLAYEKTSEELIKEIIGESKYSRNKTLIATKILKNSSRFIPFSKTGDMKPLQPEGFAMNVSMKISVDDLQALLLENGLFYTSDSTPMILPTIRILDRVNSRSYFWWNRGENFTNQTFLMKQGRLLEDYLKSALVKNNFYLIKTQQFKYLEALPESPRNESVRIENWQAVAQRVGAQIQVLGEVSFGHSKERSDAYCVFVNLSVVQVLNGRIIAEIARNFETEAGAFEVSIDKKINDIYEAVATDLSQQILEAWQKGTIGTELYKLTIHGRLPLVSQEAFKEFIRNKAREIKNIKERVISSESLVYEVDASISPKDLSTKAAEIDLGNGLKVVLESVTDREVFYKVMKAQ